jgi:hypothetical protein
MKVDMAMNQIKVMKIQDVQIIIINQMLTPKREEASSKTKTKAQICNIRVLPDNHSIRDSSNT